MKKNKKEDGVKYENFFEVFMRNYKNVPGFKEFVKLVTGSIIIFVLFVVMIGTNNQHRNDKNVTTTTTTTTTTVAKLDYGDILKTFLNNKHKIEYVINYNNSDIIINYDYQDSVYNGYIETQDYLKKFIIKNNIIFELKLNNEIENNELFNSVNKDYIFLDKLINILKNNSFVKKEQEDNKQYVYQNGIIVNVTDEKIVKIEVNNNTEKYTINIR